eukprot:3529959-Amphidinium_carterae.1
MMHRIGDLWKAECLGRSTQPISNSRLVIAALSMTHPLTSPEESRMSRCAQQRIAQLEKESQELEAERDELKRKVEEFKQAYQTVRAAQKKAKEDLDSHHRELVEPAR